MDENGFVIRKNNDSSIPFIALLGLFIGVVIFGCFFKAHDLTDVLSGVFVVTVMTGLLTPAGRGEGKNTLIFPDRNGKFPSQGKQFVRSLKHTMEPGHGKLFITVHRGD